jgi:hypothetical protein
MRGGALAFHAVALDGGRRRTALSEAHAQGWLQASRNQGWGKVRCRRGICPCDILGTLNEILAESSDTGTRVSSTGELL